MMILAYSSSICQAEEEELNQIQGQPLVHTVSGQAGLYSEILPQKCQHKKKSNVFKRDNSTVDKSSSSSCRGPKFGSQHPHSDSQPSVTLVSGTVTPSSDLCHDQVCMWYMQNKHPYI